MVGIESPLWNGAAITKLLWDLAHKADNLWVRWVHVYYFKHRDCWEVPMPRSCSWVLKKILKCREVVDNVGGWSRIEHAGTMKTKKLYS